MNGSRAKFLRRFARHLHRELPAGKKRAARIAQSYGEIKRKWVGLTRRERGRTSRQMRGEMAAGKLVVAE